MGYENFLVLPRRRMPLRKASRYWETLFGYYCTAEIS
jgi:hypothetical protein